MLGQEKYVVRAQGFNSLVTVSDIGYKGGIFTPGSQSHLMMFYAEARDENYLDVVEMMKNALLNVEFSADRAKSKLSQLLNRIPGLKVDLFFLNFETKTFILGKGCSHRFGY